MNKLFIYEYMMKINRDDIKNFAMREGIKIENKDIDTIYSYIKKDYRRILNNPSEVLREIKDIVSYDVYNKMVEFYNKYKDKIS